MNRRKFLKTLAIAAATLPILAKALSKPSTSMLSPSETEWDRCANDPVYFINNYVKVMNPVRGKLPFKLNPAQEEVIRGFQKWDRHAIAKDRQVGMTSLALAYALWAMTFKSSQNVLVGTYSNEGSKHQMKIFRFAYNNLPDWMQVPLITDNRQSMTMSHGSKIAMMSTRNSRSCGCGENYNMVLVDEAAFCENMDEFMTIIYPCITSTGAKTIMYSTDNPNGAKWLGYMQYYDNRDYKLHVL
jgi:hypothetical protein